MLAGGFAETGGTSPRDEVREVVGFGLEWRDARGCGWRLGRAAWVVEAGAAAAAPTADVSTDLAFGCDGATLARFATAEEVREDAIGEVAKLRARGFAVFILSGDRPDKVAAMAQRLHLPSAAAVAGMTPDAKAAWVRARDAGDTLMIGDGANDSLAFDAATCRGTPAVERGMLEHRADFYFLGRGLAGIRRLFDVSTQRQRAIRHVLGFAIVYNVAVVGIALAGAMNPLLAAALMPASALASLGIALVGMRRA
jgi:Cu2+-exporting ATPase